MIDGRSLDEWLTAGITRCWSGHMREQTDLLLADWLAGWMDDRVDGGQNALCLMDGYVCIMQCILPSHHQCRKVYFNFWTKPYKPSPGPLSLFSAFLFRYGIAVLLQIPIMRVITSSLRTLVYVRVWCDIIIYIGIISFLCRFHMFLACHTIDSFFWP